MALEIATAYVQIVPSARGIQQNLTKELSPISAAAAAEGTKAGQSLGGNISKGLNSSIRQLSGLAAGLGVPFAAQLSQINGRFDLSSAKAANFGKTLSNIGRTELIAAGVGLVAVGTSAVHAADQFEIAHARLQTAVSHTGRTFDQAAPGVAALDDRFVKLGFNTSDTENSLSRLTAATHNVAEATRLMGLAADIARARNIPLVQATDLLAKASLGTYTGLRRLGIVSKENIASFHSLGDVTDFLSKKFGGQAAAFADTFAGKMQALSAQANQLEVTIGTALIPKIETLASATVGTVQGFEHANAATDGWLGKTIAIGAAVPVAVFAVEKLNSVGAAFVGQFAKVITALSTTTVATEAEAVAGEAAAASKVPLITAYQAEAAATLESIAADQALAAIQFELATADQVETAALVELAAATEAAAVAKAHLAETSAAAAGAGGAGVAARGAGLLGVGAVPAEIALLATVGSAIGNAKLQENTAHLGGLAQAAIATGSAFANTLIPGANVLTGALGFLGIGHKKNTDATKEDTLASLKNALAKAQEKLANDQLAGNTKALAGDKARVVEISHRLAGAEGAVADAMGLGAAATDTAAAAALHGHFAFLGFADSVKTATDALTAISSKAFSSINLSISADTANTGVQSALDALNNPNAGAGGGGGGQTATAKALEQIQKNLTLRDSEKGVADAAQAVVDAQTQLTRAQQDDVTAVATLKTAQENYRTTLQGVAKDSQAAKDATDALAQAQDNKASAQLSVRDAQRNLEKAKNDKALLALDVKDARDKLAADKKGTGGTTTFVQTPTGSKAVTTGGTPADPETIRRDQIALNDAIIAQSGADDTVKRAELQLKDARIAARQSTKDAAEAQRVYNGTINGFPPASREAKAAQDQLTTAQRGAEDAAHAVRTAQDQLTTATYRVADANLALRRAYADLNGLLTSSSGATAAGKKLESLRTRIDNAKSAIIGYGDAEAAFAAQQAKHAGAGIYGSVAAGVLAEIQAIQGAIAGQPLLAHAFDAVFQYLQQQYVANVSQQAFHDQTSIVPGGPGHAVGVDSHNVPHRASGGPVDPHRAYYVNEQGIEMLVMGDKGGTIIPNHSLSNSRPRDGWGQGGDTYNVYGSTLEEHRLGGVIVRALQTVTDKQGFVRGVRVSG